MTTPNLANTNRNALPIAQVLTPMNPFLGLLPVGLWNLQKDFFAYTFEFLPIAATTTATTTVAIQSDSHFCVEFITGLSTSTDNTTTIETTPAMLVLLTDSGSGRQFMDRPVHWLNMIGTAQNPAVLPFPKIIDAGSTVTLQLQSFEAAARNVRVTMIGFKVFGV